MLNSGLVVSAVVLVWHVFWGWCFGLPGFVGNYFCLYVFRICRKWMCFMIGVFSCCWRSCITNIIAFSRKMLIWWNFRSLSRWVRIGSKFRIWDCAIWFWFFRLMFTDLLDILIWSFRWRFDTCSKLQCKWWGGLKGWRTEESISVNKWILHWHNCTFSRAHGWRVYVLHL